MGTQSDIISARIFFDEKGILHITGRVLFGEVEGREVMPVILYLGALGHYET